MITSTPSADLGITADPADGERDVLRQAAEITGLDVHDATLLRRHANATYLLPRSNAVARLGTSSEALAKATRAVELTRWLAGHDFPVTEPLDLHQPIDVHGTAVSFWHFYPQGKRAYPPVAALGHLLRRLHALPPPPMRLPAWQPLRSLSVALNAARTWLPETDAQFLTDHRDRLLRAVTEVTPALPPGLIHGDAARSNLLWDHDRAILGDWDGVCHGPREQDLTLTHQNVRFGLPAADRAAFAAAYGHDVTAWPGYPVLRDIHELHTLTSFLRLAPTDPEARAQLDLRITCLRQADHHTRWTAF